MASTTIHSLGVIALAAVVAPMLAELLRRLHVPSVVLEIGLGILVGQQVLGWAAVDDQIAGLSQLGLAFLMFLAGFEIDLKRIQGQPLTRASVGWLASLAIAFTLSYALVVRGFALNTVVIGLALTTTALGTLLPMLRDADVLTAPFGTNMLAIGTLGEFGPIVAVTLLLSSDNPIGTAVLLVVFVVVAVVAALLAVRPHSPRLIEVMRKNLHSSTQLPIRISVLLIVLLVWLAAALGLDVLLGAFAAGVVVRLLSHGDDGEVVRVKLDAIGFGFLIPIFFIVSGMQFDLDALLDSPSTMLRLPLFLLLFLLVRGLPALVVYRRALPASELAPLAFLSATALPMVVVITGIGVETGRLKPENAAALVGAGMLSVLIYPLVGFSRLRRAGAVPEDSTLYVSDDIDAPDPTDDPRGGSGG